VTALGIRREVILVRDKIIYVIAGSNGAGKTTFARKFLPEYAKCSNFVNADLIAQGLSPFDPKKAALKAGKLVLQQIREFADRGICFGFETTLSGKSYVKLLQELKRKGYNIHLFFLWLPDTELAIARIKDRVSEGGHNVPDTDVCRRFYRGISNFFNLYKSLLTSWMLFNNSGIKPELIAKEERGRIEIIDPGLFDKIQKM
jgi:predicted ABC-type ATPase